MRHCRLTLLLLALSFKPSAASLVVVPVVSQRYHRTPRRNILACIADAPLRSSALAPAVSSESQGAEVVQSLELVDSYGKATELLLHEIALTQAGDQIDLGIYLLEGGRSSEAVLDALEEAGGRGVRVNFGLDRSYGDLILT